MGKLVHDGDEELARGRSAMPLRCWEPLCSLIMVRPAVRVSVAQESE